MKIALFHNVPSGGAKRSTYEEVKRLSKHHAIDLFSLSSAEHKFGNLDTYVDRAEIRPFQALPLFKSPFGRLNQAARTLDLLRLRRVMRQLARQIDIGGYDVALVQPCMFTVSPTILRYLDTPSLYFRRDPVRWVQDPEYPRPYDKREGWRRRLDSIDPLRRSFYKLLVHEDVTSMRAANRVLTNSYFMRETLYRIYGMAPYVCYHGVDSELFHPLDLQRGKYVLSVGAIAPYKGYDFLIRSLAHIPSAKRPRLILVGNASLQDEKQYLTDLADSLGVAIDFRHLISNEELVRLYNQAICTVYAPMMEPFGLVPLESAACSTPVVGIREGGVRETVVPGVTGLLVDRDPKQFADAIVELLNDGRLVECLGHRAREHILDCWSWANSVSKLEYHLGQLANGSHLE